MGLDIFDYDALSGKGRSAARADTDAYFSPIDRIVVKIWQAGCSAGHKMPALIVEQQNAAKHGWILLFHTTNDGIQNGVERSAMCQKLQHMIAGLFPVLGLFEFVDVADKPAIDADEVENNYCDAAGQQQDERQHQPTRLTHIGLSVVPVAAMLGGSPVRKCLKNRIVR